MPKIYESPDGGITVRARDIGDYDNTITIVDAGITIPDVKGTVTVHDPWSDINNNWTKLILKEEQERATLCNKYPELKDKLEEYKELEKHYKAWDLLNKK